MHRHTVHACISKSTSRPVTADEEEGLLVAGQSYVVRCSSLWLQQHLSDSRELATKRFL